MKLKNKEIAKILGISPTAVSLAINNRPGVSEETREKVLRLLNESIEEDLIKEEDKQPVDVPSQKTGTTYSDMILMSIHKSRGTVLIDKPFFSDLIEAAQQEAMSASCLFSVANFLPGQDLDHYLSYIRSLNPSGLLIVATEMTEADLAAYEDLHIPFVLLDSTFDLSDADTVSLDNALAVFRAFDYAYKKGHRHIGYLQSSSSINNFTHRMDGFMKAIRKYHLEEYRHPVISLSPDIEGAQRDMTEYLEHLSDPSALPTLFLSDLDYIALGAMHALELHGYKVPDDISLIGFDDVIASSISTPPLTTIRVNHGDVARIGTEILLKKIRNPEFAYHTHTQVLSQFVIRQSVREL